MIRSMTTNVTFRHAFVLKDLERPVPPGTYRVDVEEDPIDGLSFLAYRRLATFITVPVAGRSGSTQSLLVDPKELEQALTRDAAAAAATLREPGTAAGNARRQRLGGHF
jgi:hypothetical protein